MPKPVKELELQQRPLEERILEFLAKNHQNAYTAREIWSELRSGGNQNGFHELLLAMQPLPRQHELLTPVVSALGRLEVQKRVRVLKDDQTEYYAHRDAT